LNILFMISWSKVPMGTIFKNEQIFRYRRLKRTIRIHVRWRCIRYYMWKCADVFACMHESLCVCICICRVSRFNGASWLTSQKVMGWKNVLDKSCRARRGTSDSDIGLTLNLPRLYTEKNVYCIQVNIIYFKYIISLYIRKYTINIQFKYILNFSKCSSLVKNVKLKQKFSVLTT